MNSKSNSNELLLKFKEEILSKLKENENKMSDFQRQTKNELDKKSKKSRMGAK